MEGFATGFSVVGATSPGFSLENEHFKITFRGVICDESKNIISEGFETCYDWGPVMNLILESTLEDWEVPVNIEETAENKLKDWLTTFRGWGLLSSLLPTNIHRYFILSLAFTSANWDETSGGPFTEEKAFEAVKTVYNTVPGKELASILPTFGVWFEENVAKDEGAERRKHLSLFFRAKWVLEVKFILEKKRVNNSLVELAAEAVVQHIKFPKELEDLEVPEVLNGILKHKLKDADWVRSYWSLREHLEASDSDLEFEESVRYNQAIGAVVTDRESQVEGQILGGGEGDMMVEEDKFEDCVGGDNDNDGGISQIGDGGDANVEENVKTVDSLPSQRGPQSVCWAVLPLILVLISYFWT